MGRAIACAFSAIGSKNPCYALAPYAPVAQLDRASDYESEGRKFESSRVRNEIKGQRELAFLRWGGSVEVERPVGLARP